MCCGKVLRYSTRLNVKIVYFKSQTGNYPGRQTGVSHSRSHAHGGGHNIHQLSYVVQNGSRYLLECFLRQFYIPTTNNPWKPPSTSRTRSRIMQGTTTASIADINTITEVISDIDEIISTIATAVEQQSAATSRDFREHSPSLSWHSRGERKRGSVHGRYW